MKQHIGVLLAASVLSACGSGATPSERELKRTLNDQFNNCKYLSVSNVKKLNGIPQENGTYIVQASFDVDIDSIDENERAEKAWLEGSAKYQEIASKQKAAQLELSQEDDDAFEQSQKNRAEIPYGPDHKQQDDAITSATRELRDQIRARRMEVDQRAQEARIDAGLDHFDPTTSWLLTEQVNNLTLRCFGQRMLIQFPGAMTLWLQVRRVKSEKDLVEIMSKGGSIPLELNIPMIKTDNGWMLH